MVSFRKRHKKKPNLVFKAKKLWLRMQFGVRCNFDQNKYIFSVEFVPFTSTGAPMIQHKMVTVPKAQTVT